MNVTLFAIVFFLTIVGMLVFLFLNIKSLPVVKAGKVTKPCKEKLRKLRLKESVRLVLSETYDEDQKAILYSLHPVTTIFGKVEFAM